MQGHKNSFIKETLALLDNLERDLLEAEKNHENKEILNDIFRVMHTIKGSAAMFGYQDLATTAHNTENLFTAVINGEISYSNEITDIGFEFSNFVQKVLVSDASEMQIEDFKRQLLKKVNKFIELIESEGGSSSSDDISTYYILFEPNADFEERGINLSNIIMQIEDSGETVKFEKVAMPDPEATVDKFYMFWEFFLASSEPEDEINDIFFLVEDEIILEKITEGNLLDCVEFKEKTEIFSESENPVDLSQFKSIEIKTESDKKSNLLQDIDELEKGLTQQNSVKDFQKDYINIESSKSDELMNLVSELVTVKESLNIVSEKSKDKTITEISERLDKITRNIQDNALSMRLIPLDGMMVKFEKLIRDLSNKQDKEIIFEKEGTETEMDKAIVDSLTEPLIHIFRNCIDHGIETPEERELKGKPRKGRIKFFASYSGSYVHIQIHDDGRGIDHEFIRKKAVEKGIISATAQLNPVDTLNLVFAPGFTTAKTVTAVSGRGVGMDVVKQKITDFRGEVEINSEVNLGTYISIKLPLTLSIVDALMININDSNYLLPKDAIKKVNEINIKDFKKIKNNVVMKDNKMIPIVDLKKKFGINSEKTEYLKIISVNYKDNEYGLIADGIVGEYQAVLKPLGEIFKDKDSFSGASILGDGSLALMIDINRLIGSMTKSTV